MLIADRLDRAADRLVNAGFILQGQRLRAEAERIRGGNVSLHDAYDIEREFVLHPTIPVLSRVSTLAAPGEYDGPSEPGSHTETVDGMQIEVPNGSHVEIQNGQITIVPDHAPTPASQPTTPNPPTPQSPAPAPAPAPAPNNPPHEAPSPQPTTSHPTPAQSSPTPGPIDAGTGQQLSMISSQVANVFKGMGVKYPSSPGLSSVLSAPPASRNLAIGAGSVSDCSNFVKYVLNQAGLSSIPYTPTAGVTNSPHYTKVPAGQERAGDIIVQSGHMGIYTGNKDGNGNPIGVQMGNHQVGPAPWGPGGWFPGGGTLQFFRPTP
jgi:cell wall-associated NlpC family hydrolase